MPTIDMSDCPCCGISVPCCEGVVLPSTLRVTLASSCACLDGLTFDIEFTTSGYDASESDIQEGVWLADVELTDCPGSPTLHLEVYCSTFVTEHWGWYMSNCYSATSGGFTLIDCDPFEIEMISTNWDGCGCDGADTVTMTVTLVP